MKFRSALVAAMFLMAAFASPATAGFDEQWPLPDTSDLGHHSIVIEDAVEQLRNFSFIENFGEVVAGKNVYCESLNDPTCSAATTFHINANLGVCSSINNHDCITHLSVFKDGTEARGEFVRFVYSSHPNMFSGDGKLFAREIGSPSVWRIPDAPHEAGNLYLVIAGLAGGVYLRGEGERNVELFAQIFPVSERSVVGGDFARCDWEEQDNGVKVVLGCSSSAADYGKFRCAIFEQNGKCLLRHAHDLQARYELGISLLKPATGWFHGRMEDPTVSTSGSGDENKIVVSAAPVRVPTFYAGDYYANMSEETKRYWDECLPKRLCSAGSRLSGSDPANQKDGNKRNVVAYESPVGDRSINIISQFAAEVGDTSIASPTGWSFRTLSDSGADFLSKCAGVKTGLLAMVTTNATAYAEGPPKFDSGYLNYKVAGLHYAPDGETVNLGTYDLVIRSDVARCLYGFSKAPVSATVSVVGEMGEENIATTVVSEKDGWLKLAAYGFTFSEKEIQVQLRQSQIKTLSNFTSSTLSSKQKAEIRAVLAKSDGNTKFICTGIRYFNQPLSENIKVRARAKAACEYAKSINPNFSYWYQTKTTQARSYNGKVMVVSKG